MAEANPSENEFSEKMIGDEQKQENEMKNDESKNIREPKPVTITDIELENKDKEIGEYKDKYLRLLAESENARKRLYRERQELTQFSIQNVMVDFLDPIDHMENALKFTEQMTGEVKHWALGFQMILGQFKDMLSRNGVTGYKSVGEVFDPHLHEAIEMIETDDHLPGIVIEESIRGYKMGDRVIRPARVKVSKALSKLEMNNDTLPATENQD